MTAPSRRRFVSYIDRSREFYAAQGYPQPYRWARRDHTPFAPLDRPLSDARVGVVTTSTVPGREPKSLYHSPSKPTPSTMQTRHLQWHQAATHTDDVGSFLPLDHLHRIAGDGVIGSVSSRFYGAPTVYSERRTERNAAEIGRWAREDEIDLMLLVPL